MTAFSTADILLPNLDSAGMSKWSVVACDQYTSEPQYWQDAERIVGAAPSTLKLILPEVWLESGDKQQRIAAINKEMHRYISDNLFREYINCFMLTKRTQADGRVRTGLIGVIDLEQYDYHKGSTTQVRATESTVAERIPPRVEIRRDAPLELPHIMILIDDPEKTVIEPLEQQFSKLETLYDFDLMCGGGHLCGALVNGYYAESTAAALDKLYEKALSKSKDGNALLYAIGDGNHSLAAAKECYEQKKRAGSRDAAAARYALVEVVNLHSPAIEFEAIHRVVTQTNSADLLAQMTNALGLSKTDESGLSDGAQYVDVVSGGKTERYEITKPCSTISVGSLQNFLDEYLSKNAGKIDYIHGEDVVKKLCAGKDDIGFLLPSMRKDELFPTVINDGALPRKTFSMGHANDKRFYCELRIIND